MKNGFTKCGIPWCVFLCYFMLTQVALAQEDICIDFNDKQKVSVSLDDDCDEICHPGVLDNWGVLNIRKIAYDNDLSQGGSNDYYLELLDGSCDNGGSFAFNDSDFNGNWLLLGSNFCYDIRLISDTSGTTYGANNIRINNGSDECSSTIKAVFKFYNPLNILDEWVNICIPIDLADSTGNLPSNAQGYWEVNTGSPADWDLLVQNVQSLSFYADADSGIETWGLDNVCFDGNVNCNIYEVNLPQDIAVCGGDPYPILDISGQVPEYDTITWIWNGNVLPQSPNPEMLQTGGSGMYNVVVTYGDSCTTTDIMVITNCDPIPICGILPKIDTRKKNCTVEFTPTDTEDPNGQAEAVGFLWDFGDGHTSTEESPIHSYTSPGTYLVTLTTYVDNHGACCLATSQEIIVIDAVCPEGCRLDPRIAVDYINSSVALFSSESLSNGFTSISGYKWTINGIEVSNEEHFASEYRRGDQVCLTIYGMTEDGKCCTATTCVSLSGRSSDSYKNAAKTQDFEMYPNPSKGQVTLDFIKMKTEQPIKVEIYDLSGRQMYSGNTLSSSLKVDNSSWASGMYICRVYNEGSILTKKIIKE